MKASLITENVDFLNKYFSQFRPQLFQIELIGTVSVFSFFFESENILSENWEAVTSSIATNYQSEFEKEENEFERWNIYILFIIRDGVSTQLKYKIENDKFSSRKIVQDNFTDELNVQSISGLIAQHIANSDLKPTELNTLGASASKSMYSNNSEIYQLIESSNLKIAGKATDKIEIKKLYQQIFEISQV